MKLAFPLRIFRQKEDKDGPRGRTARLFELLRRVGFEPVSIIDVGGNRGDWTRDARRAFPDARVLMFEPLVELAKYHRDLEEDPLVVVEKMGCGNVDDYALFTVHDRDDSSSFSYSVEAAQMRQFEQRRVPICRLDTYMRSSEFESPTLIKIDAEGLDIEVLKGGAATIENAVIVLVECSVANDSFPNTLSEVTRYMDCIGFRLFDITDLNRTPAMRSLWLIETVFVKIGSTVDRETRNYN